MHRADVDEAVGVQALGVLGLAEDREILGEQCARRGVEVVLVQVGEEHGVDAGDGGLGGSGRSTSGLGRGFGVSGHGRARAGRIELRIDEQRVTRGRHAQGRGADQGQVHGPEACTGAA